MATPSNIYLSNTYTATSAAPITTTTTTSSSSTAVDITLAKIRKILEALELSRASTGFEVLISSPLPEGLSDLINQTPKLSADEIMKIWKDFQLNQRQ